MNGTNKTPLYTEGELNELEDILSSVFNGDEGAIGELFDYCEEAPEHVVSIMMATSLRCIVSSGFAKARTQKARLVTWKDAEDKFVDAMVTELQS